MGLGWGAVFFRLPVDLEDELLRRAPEEDAVRFPPVDFFWAVANGINPFLGVEYAPPGLRHAGTPSFHLPGRSQSAPHQGFAAGKTLRSPHSRRCGKFAFFNITNFNITNFNIPAIRLTPLTHQRYQANLTLTRPAPCGDPVFSSAQAESIRPASRFCCRQNAWDAALAAMRQIRLFQYHKLQYSCNQAHRAHAPAVAGELEPHPACAVRGPRLFICPGGVNPPGIKALLQAKRLGRRTRGDAANPPISVLQTSVSLQSGSPRPRPSSSRRTCRTYPCPPGI